MEEWEEEAVEAVVGLLEGVEGGSGEGFGDEED